MADAEERLARLEEQAFFQEERLNALDVALTDQQRQMDQMARDLADALAALAELTGEDATEATIDEVFSTFCVGK